MYGIVMGTSLLLIGSVFFSRYLEGDDPGRKIRNNRNGALALWILAVFFFYLGIRYNFNPTDDPHASRALAGIILIDIVLFVKAGLFVKRRFQKQSTRRNL